MTSTASRYAEKWRGSAPKSNPFSWKSQKTYRAIARARGKAAQRRAAIQIFALATRKSSQRTLTSQTPISASQLCPRSKTAKQGLPSLSARRRRPGVCSRTWRQAPLAVCRSSQSRVTGFKPTESRRTPIKGRTMRVKIRRMRLSLTEASTF